MASLRHILFLGLVVLLVLGVNGTPEAEKEKEIIHKKHHRQHHHHHESSHKEKTKIHKGSPHDPKGVVAEVITDVAEAAPAVIEEGAKIIGVLNPHLKLLIEFFNCIAGKVVTFLKGAWIVIEEFGVGWGKLGKLVLELFALPKLPL